MWGGEILGWFYVKNVHEGQTTIAVADPLTLRTLPKNEIEPPMATFSLTPDEGQALMDELWQLGLRPSEGTGSAGALAATQKHLEDARKLVGKAYGVTL